ncbi:plasmid replication protein RepC [Rhizobium leguminosarum]|uniref:plasmid replication protein RepC n=1 Tax=Rhizobium leguminosarum TaxID=384 RepID=UPI001C9420FF|nr:plasmid replication protein RepC [Rhizobium leguminosarum]MBY5521496.1 replication initiation protein RepC [Rhizobium leguminosarum]MBY5561449.1 replication initiation protein RepC [Rhizobium leguminosarum]MBY5609657.1 replication initiation protein RepC [Rhizobium leguminosarum]MBY5616351.1 replication initiation protein RepC [Rhizobium leguminosarum]MBY5641854.1 replication initiation protein RepC [Rhizobium leguminosarum]
MESGYVTTPFGRRPMSLGMLASQQLAETIEPGMKRSKWKLFRAICEARPALGVTDRALTVLDALLTFYPDDEISEEKGLIVFPSNAQLSLRARGMTPATLRRHLAVLVEAGLILRKDSPNGKRYARRDRAGAIGEAFGFSVAPLLARAVEIESLAAQAVADRELLRVTRERLTVCRRDISKLIEAALEEGVSGNWEGISAMFRALLARIPRVATVEDLAPLLDEMGLLRAEIVNMLERRIKAKKIDANESQIEHHKQNSNPDSLYELEPSFETKQGEKAAADNDPNAGPSDERRLKQQKPSGGMSNRAGGAADPGAGPGLKSFPLGLVLQACPSILDYGPGGSIGNWRDLMSAAVVVRSMLGVSPSAYEEACSGMGPENAATVIACILERGGHINSPGGYLRDLTRRTERGEFAIGPMLMALVRANGPTVRHAS